MGLGFRFGAQLTEVVLRKVAATTDSPKRQASDVPVGAKLEPRTSTAAAAPPAIGP